jgi:hypothetical protein
LVPDTSGDVGLADDDRDRQLDRAAAVGLLLDAWSGRLGLMATIAIKQSRAAGRERLVSADRRLYGHPRRRETAC